VTPEDATDVDADTTVGKAFARRFVDADPMSSEKMNHRTSRNRARTWAPLNQPTTNIWINIGIFLAVFPVRNLGELGCKDFTPVLAHIKIGIVPSSFHGREGVMYKILLASAQ
jgi:hypothetical protein